MTATEERPLEQVLAERDERLAAAPTEEDKLAVMRGYYSTEDRAQFFLGLYLGEHNGGAENVES